MSERVKMETEARCSRAEAIVQSHGFTTAVQLQLSRKEEEAAWSDPMGKKRRRAEADGWIMHGAWRGAYIPVARVCERVVRVAASRDSGGAWPVLVAAPLPCT